MPRGEFACRLGGVTLAVGLLLGSRPAARQEARFAVVLEPPDRAEAALNALGDKGYWCGAVARPEPGVALRDLVTVLVRPMTTPSTVQYRVVSGFAGAGRTPFDVALTKAGMVGHHVCGFTSLSALGRNEGPQVALMMRNPSDSLEPREYRAIYTSGRGEWRALEATLADGFTITRVEWAPPAGAGTVPQVVFLGERDPAGVASRAEQVLESEGTSQGLAHRVTAHAADGYRVAAAWTARARCPC